MSKGNKKSCGMGSIISKKESSPGKELGYMGLREKIKLLQDEIHEIKQLREMECQTHERQVRISAWKEAEWKDERKKLREEVRRLRKELTAKEVRIQGMENGVVAGKSDSKEWQLQLLGSKFLVEHLREEQARRDEAVEKWKRLYIAIKTELDTLIQRAHQGDRLYWGEEQNTIEALKRELNGKEETVQDLKAKIATMEKEGVKKEREVDILRQSLRILSSKKRVTHVTKGPSKKLGHVKFDW
ncbi:uncharacterized protein LOC122653809 [Telopea speciosissima]|uniref:uncharacterized protein LOC122653809 n=1 Tax=Telopea speciosissima TaxID=54955 RepID=UPI001CC44BAF|nr:uncharacterized protein LOC122653809 [Telopea speciosissima]XP_043703687.1 uncharacterized protein LOC122653809 [Telopea speciosissima]